MKNRKISVIITGLIFFVAALLFVLNTTAVASQGFSLIFVILFILIAVGSVAVPVFIFLRVKRQSEEQEDNSEDASFDAVMRGISSEPETPKSDVSDTAALKKKYDKMLRDGLIDKAEYKALLKEHGLK